LRDSCPHGSTVALVPLIQGIRGRTSWSAKEQTMMVPTVLDAKGTKILAKSLFKELRGNGYSANQILSLSTELIDLVTQDLREANAQAEQGADAQLQA
jgi:hypothetical protein